MLPSATPGITIRALILVDRHSTAWMAKRTKTGQLALGPPIRKQVGKPFGLMNEEFKQEQIRTECTG